MSRDVTTSFARTLVDEWARQGITRACLAPGSRSTPLALALAGDERIHVDVQLDERSASFTALGIAKATGVPAVLLCTSGTAAANFHPAVLEAHHARVPMLVCTADRPPELRDTGAGQTVDQVKLYGSAVRWYCDPGPPEDRPGVGAEWRALASRAVHEARGPVAGPVHLNLPFREPLVPTGAPLVDAPGRSDGRPWTARAPGVRAPSPPMVDAVADLVGRTERGIVIAGWGADVSTPTVIAFAEAAGWPILADPLSNLRVPGTVSAYDPLLRDPAFMGRWRPELVFRLGAPPTNKPALQWLDPAMGQVRVDPDGTWLDPAHAVSGRLLADPEPLLAALTGALGAPAAADWRDAWSAAESCARDAVDGLIDAWREPFEGRVARDVAAAIPDGGALVVASSMPVRDVESFAAARDGLTYFANRGANGIDGFVSTALGIASARAGAPTVALLGDLCLLHDTNGLLGAADRGVDATLVVVDNGGGGIFSFLPQAADPTHFETLFGTPQPVDVAALVAVHGIPTTEVGAVDELAPAVARSITTGGVNVVRVRTDRADNVARHREVWAAVAANAAVLQAPA
jgi:2-succinyl-5-enolpyruvyl-6-hydroxy-3-cyclohexene-1-carboxylate synthase